MFYENRMNKVFPYDRRTTSMVVLRTFNNRIVGTMCATSVSTVAKSMADKQIHAVLWKI